MAVLVGFAGISCMEVRERIRPMRLVTFAPLSKSACPPKCSLYFWVIHRECSRTFSEDRRRFQH